MNFSEKTFQRLLENPQRGKNAVSSKKLNRKLSVEEQVVDGFRMLTIKSATASQNHIFFLHGGAYVAEATKGHRILMEKLALDFNFIVTFIDYPLAPENNATKTIDVVEKAYLKIIEDHKNDNIFLLGDSAGGGLALSLLQRLSLKQQAKLPQGTALLSPWVDVSLTNPDILKYIEKDVLLSFKGLKKCGELYADDLELNNPVVSPLYGNLENLSKIKIWVSDHELLYPDCLLLKSKLDEASGTTCSITIKEKMIHDWVILPIKEQDETLQELVNFY